jgi:hypothetical protein
MYLTPPLVGPDARRMTALNTAERLSGFRVWKPTRFLGLPMGESAHLPLACVRATRSTVTRTMAQAAARLGELADHHGLSVTMAPTMARPRDAHSLFR